MSATDRPRLVYLHGFRSSPKSFKAQMIDSQTSVIFVAIGSAMISAVLSTMLVLLVVSRCCGFKT